MNNIHINQNIIFGLASKSLRRIEIIKSLGLSFNLLDATDEEPIPLINESPIAYSIRASEFKAINNNNIINEFVIAADTIVCQENKIFGKPYDNEEASKILLELNNKNHSVITTISIFNMKNKSVSSMTKISDVKFKNWNKSQIINYINNNNVLDKAGAYAIQDEKHSPVKKFIGCKLNIIGLPVCNLIEILTENKIINELNISKEDMCVLVKSWQEREGSNP